MIAEQCMKIPRIFNTESECLAAAVEKEKSTREMLTDEDGFLTVEHLEVGCEKEKQYDRNSGSPINVCKW